VPRSSTSTTTSRPGSTLTRADGNPPSALAHIWRTGLRIPRHCHLDRRSLIDQRYDERGRVDEQQHASVPLRRVRAVAGAGRLFSTSSRPALRAAACGGRPRPAAQQPLTHCPSVRRPRRSRNCSAVATPTMADAALEADSPGGLLGHAVAGVPAAGSSGSIRRRRTSRMPTMRRSASANNNPVPG
jgi:hypothetical protein